MRSSTKSLTSQVLSVLVFEFTVSNFSSTPSPATFGFANVAKAKLLLGRLKKIHNESRLDDPRRAECLIMTMYLLDVVEGRMTSSANNLALAQVEGFCDLEELPMEHRIDFRMTA